MHRFFFPGPWVTGETVGLPPDTARQARRVLRLGPGDRIVLFNGDGREAEAVLETGATARVLEIRTPAVELPCRLHVAVAVLKGEKLDWVVQKLTELGAAQISFLTTRRVVADAGAERWERRVARYERIAREAAEQSGRVRVPGIGRPRTLADVLTEPGRRYLLSPESAASLSEALHPCPPELTLLIGPEGGFAPEEMDLARRGGAEPVRMGRRVLRAETAALAAATLVMAAAEA